MVSLGMSSQPGLAQNFGGLLSTKDSEPVAQMPGFRFHPTEEELVGYYLAHMIDGRHQKRILRVIRLINFYQFDPWELPAMATVGEREWYFFCLRDRKYQKGLRANRTTFSGYWKATGSERPVKSSSHTTIGMKKTLVFYTGRAPNGTKSNWIMTEYRLASASETLDDGGPMQRNSLLLPGNGNAKGNKRPCQLQSEVALCRVYKKSLPMASSGHLPAPTSMMDFEHDGEPCPIVRQHILEDIADVGHDSCVCSRSRAKMMLGRFPRNLPSMVSNPNDQHPHLQPNLISGSNTQVIRRISELPSELACFLDELAARATGIQQQRQSSPLRSSHSSYEGHIYTAGSGHLQDPARSVHPNTPVASPEQPSWLQSIMSPSLSGPPPLALSPWRDSQRMLIPASASDLHPGAALLSWLCEDWP